MVKDWEKAIERLPEIKRLIVTHLFASQHQAVEGGELLIAEFNLSSELDLWDKFVFGNGFHSWNLARN